MVRIVCTALHSECEPPSDSGGAAPGEAFARKISGKKYLNRATRMAIQATDKLEGAGLPALGTEGVGLCVASFGAHFDHILEQQHEIITSDHPLISPLHGPNNTPNAICGQLAIYLQAKAFALTFCDCGTSGLEAFVFGVRAILSNQAKIVVVCGTESPPSKINRALFGQDQSQTARALAITIVLSARHARQVHKPSHRPAVLYRAHGRSFSPRVSDQQAWKAGMKRCLADTFGPTGSGPKTPDAVILGSPRHMHQMEHQVVRDFFGAESSRIDFLNPEIQTESLQVISGLAGIHNAAQHLTGGHENAPGPGDGNDRPIKNILVNDFRADGSMACLLLSSSARSTS